MREGHIYTKYVIALVLLVFVAGIWLVSDSATLRNGEEGALASREYNVISSKSAGTEFPPVLSPEDQERYQRIFILQKKGKWKKADDEIALLENTVLLGHVLSQRYLHPVYRSSDKELKKWVDHYSDHPDAYRIYRLAAKKNPNLKYLGDQIKYDYLFGYGDNAGLSKSVEHIFSRQNWKDRAPAQALWRRIHYYIKKGWVSRAKRTLEKKANLALLTSTEINMLRYSIAKGYFAYGKDDQAYMLAEKSVEGLGTRLPKAYWLAGISAWRQHRLEEASRHFSSLARIRNASSWDRAAGAFWAYRAYEALGKEEDAQAMLEIGTQFPRTFYGILATRKQDSDLELKKYWSPLSEKDTENLLYYSAIRRTLALVEVGQLLSAEKELRRFYPQASLPLKKKLLSFANAIDVPGLQIRMAKMISSSKNRSNYDFAVYPIPNWKPEQGFTMDPALLFALIRHESGFNPRAKSHMGARGLMQIMPNTAAYIAKKSGYKLSSHALYQPEKNMQVGQDYVRYLFSKRSIAGNLFFLTAAYNAGPNRLLKWLRNIDYNNDPLLFIESIPSQETRNYVERVMTNFWIYRERLGYSNESVDLLLDGSWPVHEDYIHTETALAEN